MKRVSYAIRRANGDWFAPGVGGLNQRGGARGAGPLRGRERAARRERGGALR